MIITISPVSNAPVHIDAVKVPGGISEGIRGIELPLLLTGGGIDGKKLHPGGDAIKPAIHHDGIAFHRPGFSRIALFGVIDPSHLQSTDIACIHL